MDQQQYEPDGLDRQGSAIEPDLGGHPLFPRPETETGPDPRKFDLIQIIRFHPETNAREVCPTVWKGAELRSWQQIVDLYGGDCYYQLQAQCAKTHRYTARSEKLYFGGPPRKPFIQSQGTPTPIQMNSAPTNPALPPPYYYPPPPAPVSTAPAGMGPEFIALLRVMLENNANVQAAIMRSLLERSQQPQDSSLGTLRDIVIPLIEKQHQPAQQSALEMVKEIAPLFKSNGDSNKNGGATYERGMERGLELARALGTGAPQSDDFGEIAKMLTLFKSATGANSPAPPPPPPPPPLQPQQPPPSMSAYGYSMGPLPPPAPGWEWVHTPMGIVMRPISSPPMPVAAPVQYGAPAQPAHYAPPPVPAPQQAPPPVQYAPAPVQSMPPQNAPMPASSEPPAQVPLVSNPAPMPFAPPNVPVRQPAPPPSNTSAMPTASITESMPVAEIVPQRRTAKGGAPYLKAAGFIHVPPDGSPPLAPAHPFATALGNGAALLQDPEFMQKAAAFMAGDMSQDKLAELLAAAEKAGGS